MKAGLTSSIALHAAILGWAFLTVSAPKAFNVADVEALPVDVVPFDAVSHVQVGDKKAPAKTKPSPKPTERPTIDNQAEHVGDNTVDLKTQPTPEPAKVPVEATEQPKAAPPPPVQPPAPSPPKEETRAAQPPPPPPAVAEAQPKPDVAPDPVAKAITAASADDQSVKLPDNVPTPQARPTPPKPQVARTQPAPAQPQTDPSKDKSLDDKIAALLNHEKPAGGGARRSDMTASLGADTSNGGETLTQSEMDALRAQIERCWSPPVGVADASDLKISVKMKLDRSGALQADPQVISGGGGTLGQIAVESAMRAVMRCAPYKLPPDKYQAWADVIVNFDPSQMF